MTERYFIGVGEDAEALKERVLGELTQQRIRQNEVAAKYDAPRFYTSREGRITKLSYRNSDKDFVCPEGMRRDFVSRVEDGYEHVFIPDLRTKTGKAIKADFQSIPAIDGSSEIVRHYGAARHAVVPHSGPTRFAMAVTVGGIVKDQVVLRVPTTEDDPFKPDSRLKEIKKSEYIALTEE